MKKALLLLCTTLCAINFLSAQNAPLFGLKTNFDLKKQIPQRLSLQNPKTGDEAIPRASNASIIAARSSGATPGSIVLGTTMYDLETNGSVARRLLRRSDGTMTAVWTMAQLSSFTDRGTAYAYFDGTSWTCTNPASRLENIKTGWPNIGMLNGKEFIMCHNGNGKGNLEQGTSGGIGQCSPTDWTFDVSGASAPIPPGDTETIWARMTIQGNVIHVMSSALNASTDVLAGVSDPTVYARSTDGGVTWTPNIVLPLNDSTRRITGSADEYDMDNNDGVAAIVLGGLGYDVALWKSIDSGARWQHIYVDSFPYAPDYSVAAPEDSIVPTNDGGVSTVVDNSGKIHVAYSLGYVTQIANTGYYFPFTIGLKYWEEGMTSPVWVVNPDSLPSAFDANGDGLYTVGSTTMNNNAAGSADQYRNQSWLSQPSISYDESGDIFITFILPHDADTTFDGQTYRHIYLASHKAGDPWNLSNWTIQDANQNIIFTENVFPCTVRESPDSVRIEYMEDLEPGTNFNNGDPLASNNINYLAVANPFLVGINNVKAIQGIDVEQNFPNPFNKQSVIQIKMDKAAKLNFKVTDVLGKVVMQQNLNYSSGTHNITINRDQLSSGVYFYTVQAGNEQVTNKMIIE